MNAPLDIQKRAFLALRERIAAEFGLDTDDEAVIDTTEGETDLVALLARMVRQSRERAAQAKVCAEQIEALSERKRRHTDAADKLRSLIAETMLEVGLKKLAPGDFTASASFTKPKAEVVNEDELPPFYTRTVRKPDLDAIKGEVARCQAEGDPINIPGVVMSNGRPSLTVRT